MNSPQMITAPDLAEGTLVQDEAALERAKELSRAPEQPPVGVPGFRILRSLGEGKYGSVWLAREQNTGKHVAIKFYTHRRGLDWSLLSREVEKLAVLYTSRHIVGLIEVGWDGDPPYYVMEYLENGSLAGRLAMGPLSVPEAVRIANGVLLALVHAHGSGILHCDLKPANVLLDANNEPRLCDFGQSRLADEQSPSLGTLFYMAPEQADLKAIPDARWDVYALGALLYHMLCGHPPFRTPEAERRIRNAGTLERQLAAYREIVKSSPRPLEHRRVAGVDKRLAEIIERCLQPNPSKRYPNAQAVLDRLTARERMRARRPLIALGVIVPILLPLLIAPFARTAMHDAVSTARRNVTARALESDVLSANLLASNIEREFEDREAELLRVAGDEEVRKLVAELSQEPREARQPLWALLDKKWEEINRQRERHRRSRDTSWFLTDAKGYQRWRMPEGRTTDLRFAHRDYFHGHGREYSRNQLPDGIEPIRQPYVSTAFHSDATNQYMVAISVPVWDLTDERVIGVLARTVHLGELLIDYEQALLGDERDVRRHIAIIDSRDWKLLAHPWLAEVARTHPQDLSADVFQRLTVTGPVVEQLSRLTSKRLSQEPLDGEDRHSEYLDPVAVLDPEQYGGSWLAAFAPISGTGWLAVVQERRDAALKPVEEMRARVTLYGLGVMILVGLVIGGCWFFVLRVMNERSLPLWPATGSLTSTTASDTGLSAKGAESV